MICNITEVFSNLDFLVFFQCEDHRAIFSSKSLFRGIFLTSRKLGVKLIEFKVLIKSKPLDLDQRFRKTSNLTLSLFFTLFSEKTKNLSISRKNYPKKVCFVHVGKPKLFEKKQTKSINFYIFIGKNCSLMLDNNMLTGI